MKSRYKSLIVALLMVFSARTASAQSILPASFGNWTAAGSASVLPAEQVERIAGDKTGLLRELGVTSAEQSGYAEGQQTASVTLYRMVDPSAAYGAFTVLREPQMTPVDLGDSAFAARATSNRACFIVGDFVVLISASGDRPDDGALTDLAATLLPQADRRPYPNINGFLPVNAIPGSERYVLGPRGLAEAIGWTPPNEADWMGYSTKSAESAVARYDVEGPEAREMILILTLYPTRQVATEHFETFRQWVNLGGNPAEANGRPMAFAGRRSALVGLVFGANSREEANTVLNQVRYRSIVTWNEPGHEATDPALSTIIIGVFQGTGLITLLAFAAGLGFGGFRLIIKAFFPGRVFDRRENVEILQLGLSSKPIDARDFY
jgi:hypothetical protein